MAKQDIKFKKGFTIIEVVLVLAIAGLIFLMVFVAYPALSRSQHDTQRRSDYATLATAVSNYMTNSHGKLPVDSTTNKCKIEAKNSLGNEGTDPSGDMYNLLCAEYKETGAAYASLEALEGNTQATVYIISGAKCDGNDIVESKGSRNFAIYGQLESGMYCNSSSN